MKYLALLTLVVAAACSDDSSTKPPQSDAPPAGGDAPIADPDGAPGDGQPAGDAAANACTGAAYDTCADDTQCTSGDCHTFGSAGISVCTQACDANNPCPTQSGQPVPCNNMGICRPQVANACMR